MPPPWRTDREGPVHHLLRALSGSAGGCRSSGRHRARPPPARRRWYGWRLPGHKALPRAVGPLPASLLARMCAGMTGGLRGAPDVHGASRPGGRAITTWIFEPGHTEAEFRARHMMVTWVRGLFKDIHGSIQLDWDRPLDTTFQGEIDATKIWAGEQDRGTLHRVGFAATTTINRHDFGVAWQDRLPGGGVVVSNEIDVALDVEAILEDDLERTGAIEYYREDTQPAP